MANEKIYINGVQLKEKVFQDGGSIIGLSVKLDKLIPSLQEHVNEKGYVNLKICKKRQPDQYGGTHYIELDTWRPKPQGQGNYQPQQPTQQQVDKVNSQDATMPDNQEDYPF